MKNSRYKSMKLSSDHHAETDGDESRDSEALWGIKHYLRMKASLTKAIRKLISLDEDVIKFGSYWF